MPVASKPSPSAPRSPPSPADKTGRHVVLTGNPNCGKTTLFNALTGLRAKVGNYAGVTVERKEGRLQGAPREFPVTVLDLPGTYSLSPQSLDEQISRDVLFHRLKEVPPPDLVVIVVDASNLQRHLYYATQFDDLGGVIKMALQIGGIDHDHDQIRRRHLFEPVKEHVARDLFIERLRAEAVSAGQVEHRDRELARRPLQAAFLALDRDTGVVADLGAKSGQRVEQRGLAAIGIARENDVASGFVRR